MSSKYDTVAWFRANKTLCQHAKNRDTRPTDRNMLGLRMMSRTGCGICTWCEKPCGSHRKWHKECVITYMVAKGMVRHADQRPLIKRTRLTTCAMCDKTQTLEIDHKIALGIARQSYRWQDWVRAWHVTNLQWLCHDCHVQKTTRDRMIMCGKTRIETIDMFAEHTQPICPDSSIQSTQYASSET